jgi:hypothetical protein
MSLFLIFDVENKRDDVLEAADIDDGNNTKKVHRQSGRHF